VIAKLRRPGITRTRRIEGAPKIPYIDTDRMEAKPWLKIPQGFRGSNLEWATMWYLTVYGIDPNRRKLRQGIDFYWQRALPAPGLFLSRNFTRADFVFMGRGRLGKGLVLDPLFAFTHKSLKHDLDKRRILGEQGFDLIFMDGAPLLASPQRVIEAGLRSQDISIRGSRKTRQ
jgi:hypothetical protein